MKADDIDLITPFVRELESLLSDPEISEIIVLANGNVMVEREGRLVDLDLQIPEDRRQSTATRIARLLGDDFGPNIPMLDARLPDGSRVSAVGPPVSVDGTALNIRKFRPDVFDLDELLRRKMLTDAQLNTLTEAMTNRETILISGSTGSGKTTLLNALANTLPKYEHVVVIEDTTELSMLDAPVLTRLESQREQRDKDGKVTKPGFTIRQLVRQSLRHRPDRIIVGEVRGAEGFDLVQALNTGHMGSLCTIHANSARESVRRLRTCVAMAGENLPDRTMAANIADAIQMLVHVRKDPATGHRYVAEIIRLGQYRSVDDSFEYEEITSEECIAVYGHGV